MKVINLLPLVFLMLLLAACNKDDSDSGALSGKWNISRSLKLCADGSDFFSLNYTNGCLNQTLHGISLGGTCIFIDFSGDKFTSTLELKGPDGQVITSETEQGTYTVEDNKVILIQSDGDVQEGTLNSEKNEIQFSITESGCNTQNTYKKR